MRGIYKITNITTGKCYIGSSNNVEKRWKYGHLAILKKGTHWNIYLQSAWDKYGGYDFTFQILEEVNELQDLQQREQYWMDYYQAYNRESGYNIAPDANRGAMSPETIRKIQQSRGDKYKGENAPMYGKHHTTEAKEKISAYQKARVRNPLSNQTKMKIGDFFRGKTYEKIMGEEKAQARKSEISKSYEDKYGIEKACELKQARSGSYEERYGKDKADIIKQKMASSHKGFIHSDISKELCSIAKLAENNPMYIFISEETKIQLADAYIKSNYKIGKDMVEKFQLSIYKIRQVLKEMDIYVRKK